MYTSKCVVLSLHSNEMIALFLGAGIFVSTFWGEPFNAGTHVLGNLAVVAFLSSSWNCYSEFRYPVHLPSFSVCLCDYGSLRQIPWCWDPNSAELLQSLPESHLLFSRVSVLEFPVRSVTCLFGCCGWVEK